jgi:periplasmic protein CpxP/Spy
MDELTTPTNPKTRCRRRGRLALGLVVILGGAAGLAWATGVGPAAVGHHFCRAGGFREMAEFRVHRALKQVDASEAQEERILALLDAQFARHAGMAAVHDEMHQRVLDALTGDTVDRAALEAVRADALRRADDGSRELVGAIADMAEVLTPAQRRQLAELARSHFE